MSIPGSANPLLLATAAAADAAPISVTRSLRFNSSSSSYISRTPSSAGNRKTWTLSFWVKLTGDTGHLISAGNDAFQFELRSGGSYLIANSGCFNNQVSDIKLRDFSAWQHFVIEHDATNSYCKIYINGTLQKTITASNANGAFNDNTAHNFSGRSTSLDSFTDFYLSEVHMVDGQALDPTSFAEADSDNNWNPKAYSGSGYGSNGFYLKFADNSSNSALGTDSSGNNNTFTINNLDATGQTTAAAVLNLPLNATPFADSSASSATITNTGSISTTSAATNTFNISTVASFDGSSQRLTTNNNNISFQNNWTLDTYFLIDSSASGFQALFNSGYGSQTSHYMYIAIDNNDKPYIETTSSGSRTTAANAINKNQWYHMRVIQKSGTITMFLNGTSVLTKDAQTTDLSDKGSNTIGSLLDNGNNSNNFAGHVGPFRIVNDALDAPASGGTATSSGTLSNNGIKTNPFNIDSVIDVPLNSDADSGNNLGNYCVFNPVSSDKSVYITANGNLVAQNSAVASGSSGSRGRILSSIGFKTGKWYAEVQTTAASDGDVDFAVGIFPVESTGYYSTSGHYALRPTGHLYSPAGVHQSYGTGAWTDDDIIGIAVDMDSSTKTIQFFKNGTAIASATTIVANEYFFGYGSDGGGSSRTYKSTWNFGAAPFSYAPPSGHKSLCTQNLTDPTIADGSTVFDIALWDGTGSSNAITSLNTATAPDLVWIKSRNSTGHHTLVDAVRGSTKALFSNRTVSEVDDAGYLSSFDSNGFTVVSDNDVNGSSYNYVGWAWDAGTTTVTNNSDGSITPTGLRASTTNGISIIKYTGTGSNATVGHGLNAAPEFFFGRNLDDTSSSLDWIVYHKALGANNRLKLNNANAESTSSVFFQDTHPTNSVISIGTSNDINKSGDDYVMYCFTPIPGFSAVGSFTNPSSSIGAFVYCGFRPAYIFAKCARNISSSSGAGDWIIKDTARSPFNNPSDGNTIAANVNNAEDNYYAATQAAVDILSNGFKIQHPNSSPIGDPGRLYVFFAIAEHPLKTARAR